MAGLSTNSNLLASIGSSDGETRVSSLSTLCVVDAGRDMSPFFFPVGAGLVPLLGATDTSVFCGFFFDRCLRFVSFLLPLIRCVIPAE